MRKRARQADVAALANVSPAIVSLVINGRINGNVRISAETQQRVWNAVRQLGYVANPVARKLAGNQNRLLGVFTYEAIFPLEYRNFYYPFLLGIEEEVQIQSYDLLLFTRAAGPDGSRSIYQDEINSLQVADGAILVGVNEKREELSRLLEEGYPFVFIGRRALPGGEVSYVAADYTRATCEIVEYIYSKGHRRILYLRAQDDREATLDREAGYRQAFQNLHLPLDESMIYPCEAEEITPQLLQHFLSSGVTAFVADSTSRSQRLQEIAALLGKQIPHDFSLAVLGDHTDSIENVSEITTFLIPRKQMGIEAVRLLVRLLSNPDSNIVQHITLPCTFAKGKTVDAPSRG